MANTSYGVNNPAAVKLWSRKLFHEALKATWMYKFIGKDSNNVIQMHDDTSKGAGDRVRVILRMLLSGNGIQGDGTLEGNEEALTTFTDDLLVDQLRHAVRSGGKMSEQRIPFSVREEARLGLQDWWADRMDTWAFNQLAGNTVQSDTRFTGNNSVTEADADHKQVVGVNTTTDQTISATGSSCVATINMIDSAVESAKTLEPMIRPIKLKGEDKYVMFFHPFQVFNLRTTSDTGQWLDIQKAAVQGHGKYDSPIYNGAMGEYNGVVIHESSRVPKGHTSGTENASVRRAIFCGAQAGHIAFGQGHAPSKYSWVEELFDYNNQLGVSAGCISGLKKAIFNGKDFGTIASSSFAVAH